MCVCGQASKGRTVVLTIHQPRANVFELFDAVMLLAAGRTMFFGPPSDAIAHFAKLGHNCPPLTNPADFLLDLLCPLPDSSIDASDERTCCDCA